jgi:hypothetical protein
VPTVAELQVVLEARDDLSGRLRLVGRDVERLEQQVESTGGAFGRLGGFLGGLGRIGLAGAGIGLIADSIRSATEFMGQFVDAASDLNEQISRTGVVFGDAAPAVLDFAQTTAQAMGISRTQALETAGSFGTLFRSAGLSTDAAADMSTGLVQLAADLASFNNIDPTEALDKLRSGLVGESEPLRSVGVLLSEEAVKLKAVELGLVSANQALTEAQKVQARYALILDQTRTAQGDFARTSTGLANASRIIRASFADIRTELGQAFLPVAARAATWLAQELPRALVLVRDVAQQVGPVLAALFAGDLSGALNQVVVLVTGLTERLAPALASWGQAFLGWVQEVTPLLLERLRELGGDIWAWIREQGPPFAQRLVQEWVPAFVGWVAEVVPRLLFELGQMLGRLAIWIQTTAVPELTALGRDMGASMAAGMGEGLKQVLPTLLAEGLRVDVGGIEINLAGTPTQIAGQVGAAIAARVAAALLASQASTDPGAAATQQGAR